MKVLKLGLNLFEVKALHLINGLEEKGRFKFNMN
jgi:hypothetical protein